MPARGLEVVTRAFLATALVLVVLMAWVNLWSYAAEPWSFFGGDLVAYRDAADRLISTGSPYHPALVAGPIENRVENVPIGYLYPPLLAQLFVPLAGVPPLVLAIMSSTFQSVLLLALLPMVYRRFGGILTPSSLMWVWLAAALSYPIHIAVYGGNMSGWIAIGVATMLAFPSRAGGAVAAILTVVKMTPAVLALPALLAPRTRRPALVVGVTLTAISIGLTPGAWVAWFAVLPNILMFPSGDAASNYAPVAVLGLFGLATLGGAIGYTLAGASLLAALFLAWIDRWPGAVAAGVAALLFASGSSWDHYLAPTLVLVIAAAPRGGLVTWLAIYLFLGMNVAQWITTPKPTDIARLAYVTIAAIVSAVLIAHLATVEVGRLPGMAAKWVQKLRQWRRGSAWTGERLGGR